MAWDPGYSVLQSVESATGQGQASEPDAVPSAADRDSVEQHISQVIMPLFRDIADAAKVSGRYGTAELILSQPVGMEQDHAPTILGAFLGLSGATPSWSHQCDASIRLVHERGTIFTLNRRAPDFNVTDGASLEDLTVFRLVGMVREIMASAFK